MCVKRFIKKENIIFKLCVIDRNTLHWNTLFYVIIEENSFKVYLYLIIYIHFRNFLIYQYRYKITSINKVSYKFYKYFLNVIEYFRFLKLGVHLKNKTILNCIILVSIKIWIFFFLQSFTIVIINFLFTTRKIKIELVYFVGPAVILLTDWTKLYFKLLSCFVLLIILFILI